MFTKRSLYFHRHPVLCLSQIIVPAIFAIAACLVPFAYSRTRATVKPQTLTLDQYANPTVMIAAAGQAVTNLPQYFVKAIGNSSTVDAGTSVDSYFVGASNSYNEEDFAWKVQIAATFKIWTASENGMDATAGANDVTEKPLVIGHFSNVAMHAIAIILSYADNAVLRYLIPESKLTVEVVNRPLPHRSADSDWMLAIDVVIMPLFICSCPSACST